MHDLLAQRLTDRTRIGVVVAQSIARYGYVLNPSTRT